jgi:hypothetical protein
MIANNEEAFVKVDDTSVSSRRSKIDTFLHYHLKPS